MTAVLEPVVEDVAADVLGETQVNTMTAKALSTALSDALLFTAPTSAKLPMLEALRLEFGAGQLVTVATDRFALGVSKVAYSGASLMVMLAGGDAKALAQMAKTGKREERSRAVTIDVADAGAQLTFRFNSGEEMTVHGVDVHFPTWRHLLPADASRMGGIVGMGYRAAHLSRFTKVRAYEQAAGAQMVVFPSVTSSGLPGPTAIRIGEDFFGLLMPVRPPGDEWQFHRPDWLDVAAGDSVGVR